MRGCVVQAAIGAAALWAAGCSGSDAPAMGQGGASATATSATSATSATGGGGSGEGGEGGGGAGGSASGCPGCVTLAALPLDSGPLDIELDDESVYWSNSVSGEIMKVAKTGGDPTTLATGQGAPWGIAVDAASIYWVMHTVDGFLRRAPKTGGDVVDLVAAPAARYVAVNDMHAYWSREPDDIHRADLDGQNEYLMLSANLLANTIAVDDTGVYWVNLGDGRVKFSSFDGTGERELEIDQAEPWGVAVDEAYVYWTSSGDGTVKRADKVDGNQVVELATGPAGAAGIAAHGDDVYWVNAKAGTVQKTPKNGGEVVTIATGQGKPQNIAVDATSVYWTTLADETVMKAPR